MIPTSDITIIGNKCSITQEQQTSIRERADKLLRPAMDKGFEEFPIDRGAMLLKINDRLLTEKLICRTLTSSPRLNAQNHNELRKQYMSGELTPQDAAKQGLVAMRLKPKISCPKGLNWKSLEGYNGIESCEDVTGAMSEDGLPALMYATSLPAADASKRFAETFAAALYTRHTDKGPVECRRGADFVDTFHAINVSSLWHSIKLILRSYYGENWSAWMLSRSCPQVSDKADDLTFDFGIRVFMPVDIEIDGSIETRTIVISAMAAASANPLSGLLGEDTPYYRLIGGEFAKKILLEAWSKGWKVEGDHAGK